MESKSRLLIAVVATSVACLPRGNPPAGRQLISGRSATLAALVPPNGDGLLRILFMRPNAGDSAGSDLYVVSLDAAGELSHERLLITDIETDFNVGCGWKIAPCSFDPKGRALVYRNVRPQPGAGSSGEWVDPVTGDIEDADFNRTLSGSGQRSFVVDYTTQTDGTLYDADGHATAIQFAPADPFSGSTYEFVGDDFYFINAQKQLIDIPPSDVPSQVATDVTRFVGWSTPDGALLALTRATSDPAVQQLSLRDPASSQETSLPFSGYGSLQPSPDGDWLLRNEPPGVDGVHDTLLDYRTGATQVLDFPSFVTAVWRPGHRELWVFGGGDNRAPTVWVVTPGGATITVEEVEFYGFSEDGTDWFSTSDLNSSTPAVKVGLADDPTGPRFPYNPPGTFIDKQWVLPDGRLLLSAYPKDVQRADTIVVDPRTGDSRVLAERGRVAALGQTRFIGMFHFESGRGDLTAVELPSGKATILAPEFTVTAFAEPQGTDLVAPGTRLVYQFQARTPSPYDGIWLANCP
ncbi:MAG: hypothetical protein ABUR63_07940 [Verrucomicrobiota bacterium]